MESDVHRLHRLTNIGIRDCKKILKASDNDLRLALRFIGYYNSNYLIFLDILEIEDELRNSIL